MLRPFTAWLRQFEPATEVPDEAVFGRVPGRTTPHVYRDQEIVELLTAAGQLGPPGGLRPVVIETLFGLIACTGLRQGLQHVLVPHRHARTDGLGRPALRALRQSLGRRR